jgi:hypothetical protein
MESESVDNLIIVGDFNTTLHHWEKMGGSVVRDFSREYLEDLISSRDLFDVKPSKGVFALSNRRVGPRHIVARLQYPRSSLGRAQITSPFL